MLKATSRARARLVAVLAALALLPLLGAKSTISAGYGEPLTLPGASDAADPSVLYIDGTYYMYPTSGGNKFQVWTSPDRETWSYGGVIWGPKPAGSWNDNLAWAPDVLADGGKYYLYYTANHAIGVAVADSPLGPFVDVYDHPFIGNGYGDTEFQSIDAHVFKDEDGKLYMYCTHFVPWSTLRVSTMSDPVTVDSNWVDVVTPGLVNWEFVVTEGPWMVKHAGTYYLMYSGNSYKTAKYAIGYATASDPMGPFEKFEGNPFFSTDEEAGIYGPGHHSVATDENGDMWIFYHTKISAEKGEGRRIRVNQLAFDENDELYVVLDAPGCGQ
ncbi:MAG: family 43 glycosylhydrolase [Deltaproteobacteria bacterium]|nr:family 43 glycosylhydrolase [Deltaproteobacteria bacterium]